MADDVEIANTFKRTFERFGFDRALELLDDDDRDYVEERAAIREFDGMSRREHAQKGAVDDFVRAKKQGLLVGLWFE